MDYDYNRLMEKTMLRTNKVSSVKCTYGSLNDGQNGAGRVTNVKTGFNSSGSSHTQYLEENIRYDELGNVISEEKTIAIPMVGLRTFGTGYEYDSWIFAMY